MAMNPMEQFAIKPLISEPVLHIAGHPIYFTNQDRRRRVAGVLRHEPAGYGEMQNQFAHATD